MEPIPMLRVKNACVIAPTMTSPKPTRNMYYTKYDYEKEKERNTTYLPGGAKVVTSGVKLSTIKKLAYTRETYKKAQRAAKKAVAKYDRVRISSFANKTVYKGITAVSNFFSSLRKKKKKKTPLFGHHTVISSYPSGKIYYDSNSKKK